MDWDRADERNREALLGIVSALFALVAAALMGGAGVMPRVLQPPYLHAILCA